MTGPAAPPVPAELEALMRRMRLPYLRSAAPDVLATARAQRWDPPRCCACCWPRKSPAVTPRPAGCGAAAPGFPSGKTFSSWRPEESSISAATQDALATLEWIGRAENLAVAGPVGNRQVSFRRGPRPRRDRERPEGRLVHPRVTGRRHRRAKADGSVARTVTRICRSDLIVVDDIGMLPAGQDAAEAFYRITDAAYERRSLAVTSNIHPSGFDTIMPKTLATATVDRLLHHAHLVQTSGESHRLAQALAGKGVITLT